MVNIQINEEIAEALQSEADRVGLSLEGFLASVAKKPTVSNKRSEQEDRLSLEEFEKFLDEEAHEGPSPQGTFSREELYRDHL